MARTPNMNHLTHELRADYNHARTIFEQRNASLIDALKQVFKNPYEAADNLGGMSLIAGSDDTGQMIDQDLDRFGEVLDTAKPADVNQLAYAYDALTEANQNLLIAQQRIDTAVRLDREREQRAMAANAR